MQINIVQKTLLRLVKNKNIQIFLYGHVYLKKKLGKTKEINTYTFDSSKHNQFKENKKLIKIGYKIKIPCNLHINM